MRKLAPVFLTTSILAFAAGNAAAMGDFKAKKSPEATTSPSSMSTSTTNQATPPGNSDSSTAGAMKAGEPAASSTVSPAASPTVSSNTQNPQGMSYSDKSSSAPGTNAKMDTTPGTKGVAPAGSPLAASSSTDATTALANEDKQALSRQASGEKSTLAATDATDTTTKSTVKAKKAKKKVATNDSVSGNPPTSSTNPAAAGSTTGRSPGGG